MSDAETNPETAQGGFAARARLRRRLRKLESRKEIELRDLGGLSFELHRAGRRDDQLVREKLTRLERTESELSALRDQLGAQTAVDDLHEPGVASCATCGEIIGSDDSFCWNCGKPVPEKAPA